MITLGTDKVILGEGDDCCFLFPCFTYDKVGADTVTVKDGRGLRYRLTPDCTRLADQAAIVAFLESANDLLCGGDNDIDPDFEYVGITTTVYCRLSDNKKVVVRTCKLEDGSIEITDTDSGATLTDATLASGYDAECPVAECLCTEMTLTVPEGQTVTHSDLLTHFEAVGTFDDGSKSATGISEVDFGNLAKDGLSMTYNGTTRNDYAGSFHFGNGSNFNDISNDLSITSNRGETTVTYVVYKCN